MEPPVQLIEGTLEQLLAQLHWQSAFHFNFQFLIAIALFNELGLKVIPEIILIRLTNTNGVHKSGVKDEFCTKLILAIPGFQQYLHDIVNNVSIEQEAAAEADRLEDYLIRVVRRDVSIADRRDRVYTPVQRVEVAHSPSVGHNGRVGSGRVKPAHWIGVEIRDWSLIQIGLRV